MFTAATQYFLSWVVFTDTGRLPDGHEYSLSRNLDLPRMKADKPEHAAVFARESGRLLRFVRRQVANLADAEDLVQDVFCEFLRLMDSINPIDQVGAWLFTTARRRLIDRHRWIQRDQRWQQDLDWEALGLLGPSAATADPEQAHQQDQLAAALISAIESLPPAQREVYVAHELEGRSFRSLSTETGLSINTLLARKRYAVLSLRQQLAKFQSPLAGD